MNMDWILECCPDYDILVEFDHIEDKTGTQEIHGLKERTGTRCLFCNNPYSRWKKKDVAHAVSECLGNKRLINYCECYDCNHLFGEIAENHLGKFIMPYRLVNEVYGKGACKNVVKDMPVDADLSYRTFRFEQKKNGPVFPSDTFDVHNMLIEQSGTERLTQTEDGVRLSIPRQNYDPRLVYVSLLKIAYTLLPASELPHYIVGKLGLYLSMSEKPPYDGTGEPIPQTFSDEEKKKYMDGLPYVGTEIRIASPTVPNSVNVCLLKRIKEAEVEPKLLLAVQMKWCTIVIPVLSDSYVSGAPCRYSLTGKENIFLRKLDFTVTEPEYLFDMTVRQMEIPKELYPELEENLRSCGLLRKSRKEEGK